MHDPHNLALLQVDLQFKGYDKSPLTACDALSRLKPAIQKVKAEPLTVVLRSSCRWLMFCDMCPLRHHLQWCVIV